MFHALIEDIIRNISGSLGRKLRFFYYKKRLKSCGENVYIDTGVHFEQPNLISIGNQVWIDKNVICIAGKLDKKNVKYINKSVAYEGEIIIGNHVHIGISTIIQGHGGVKIGDYFTTSAKCSIYSMSNNPYQCKYGTFNKGEPIAYYINPVKIENNVWLGLNVAVIGNQIGQDCFIQPNSVITFDIPSNSIVKGFPAQVIKERFLST